MKFQVLLCLLVITTCAFAQRERKLEVAFGIGTDIIPMSDTFKNDHNLSASFCYDIADRWGLILYCSRQTYKYNRLSVEHVTYLDGAKPQITKTISSVLLMGRYLIPTGLARVNPYVSLGLGYSKSASSSRGFYVIYTIPVDTEYFRIDSGGFLLGLLSFGIQVEPCSFLTSFAELQRSYASSETLYPGAFAVRMGIGVRF